ncbi:protein scarlet-like, partial [Amphibalanus amphitrite]|uniref:protein scarlet-like n=1 Tax=Amphibalanus amphitrite TaxID=1232801 RepID=UPI001C907E21
MVRRDDGEQSVSLLGGRRSPREYSEHQRLLETELSRESAGYGAVKPLSPLPTGGVTLTWHDVNVYVPDKKNSSVFSSCQSEAPKLKRVLNNVYGAVLAGNLVAVMGSSGSGKSTLMTTLAQRNPGEVMVDADIQYNGQPATKQMRSMAGFVYQDDMFVGSLTVREHLEFAVRRRSTSSAG